ncbi:hypothetical protein FRACYDRAFT_236889 [Fragilariopsis cylindrus CCMP1102]|uniref:Sphingomyelin synthase-like domain-containing protein n=1 Tax=Fragilariopsis cylindrus CCMP1102 TaxID=635003 RepID=A0A1E7FKB7_9STRA|nr:hypothetical protein FRACYDRAFT_236889 [Fragilariopsis cylindrus CCMP1102]|eukprot:OEU18612.1 hypothetical protein FRACYDRAFT_236889 [Fragilariopsis cylindrus CCMP1102]
MPLHRRHVAESGSTKASTEYDGHQVYEQKTSSSSDSGSKINTLTTSPTTMNPYRSRRILLGLILLDSIVLITVAAKSNIKSTSHLLSIIIATFISTLPIFLTLAVGLGISSNSMMDLPHQRYIPLTVVATIVGNQLPVYISFGMASIGIFIFGLASRPVVEEEENDNNNKNKNEEDKENKKQMYSGQINAVMATLLLIAALLTENFFIWVVSASYTPSQNMATLPSPLQDNGQILLRYLFDNVLALSKRDVVKLRNMINVEGILASGLGLSIITVVLQGSSIRRNMWSMAMRGVLTLAAARSIRTISFLITVLPSQNPKCYFSHFPTPPEDWFSWFMVGMIPQVNGGCNDLIISGHATVTSTLACVVTSVVRKPLFTTALWMFIALDYGVEIYEGFHYSVDMVLGAILVNLLFAVLAPLEEATGQMNQASLVEKRKFHRIQDSTYSDIIMYLLPALGVYIQLVGFIPQDFGNYSNMIYTAVVIYQISRFGFQHYSQHILFCLLFMVLGLFL